MTPDAKTALRRRVLAARSAIAPGERRALSAAVAERVAALPAFAAARTIALYAPLGAEVDTEELWRRARAAGKAVAWPLVGAGQVLGFAACAREQLQPGGRGAMEPPPGAAPVDPGELDLVCVPGVAFDASLRRLGRGGGHYDATLPRALRARKVGLAFEVQIVAAVPAEPHDVPVDLVVTEARVIGSSG